MTDERDINRETCDECKRPLYWMKSWSYELDGSQWCAECGNERDELDRIEQGILDATPEEIDEYLRSAGYDPGEFRRTNAANSERRYDQITIKPEKPRGSIMTLITLPEVMLELDITRRKLATAIRNAEIVQYPGVSDGTGGKPPRRISRDSLKMLQEHIERQAMVDYTLIKALFKKFDQSHGWQRDLARRMDTREDIISLWINDKRKMRQFNYDRLEQLLTEDTNG